MVGAQFVHIFAVIEREQGFKYEGGGGGGGVRGAEVDFTARCVRPGMTPTADPRATAIFEPHSDKIFVIAEDFCLFCRGETRRKGKEKNISLFLAHRHANAE